MNKPTKTLALLIVEDMESDALLIVRLLKKAGYELVYEQVETAAEMRAMLEKRDWDIIISDYKMPQFDGCAALQLIQDMGSDIPFIVVSGTIGEETAVSMMRAGASDYLVKGNLERLVPAVEREIRQAEVRRERRQADKDLQVSAAQLNTLVQVSPLAIILLDAEGKVLLWNLSAEQIFGWKAQEVMGHPNPIVPSSMQDEYKDWSEQVSLNKTLTNQEAIRQRKDGSLVHVSISSAAVYDDKGTATGRMAIIADITKQKKAEETLAASEAELRALVEQTPAIVYTESADTRKTTYISPQVEKVTGYTPAEWIEDHELWKKMIHPEDRSTVEERDTLTSATHQPFHAEYRMLTRDGRTTWIHDEAVLIQNQDGIPLFWQGVMYDITERKQIEESMQNTNILLEQTLEQSPIPMVLVSMPDGIIRSINSACRHFLGIDDEPSPAGMPLSKIKISWQELDMQGNPATSDNLPLPRSLRGLKTEAQELRIIHKDGTTVYGLMYGSPIFDTAGRLIAGYLVMMDITERKQAEEFLQKSEERYRELFNSMIDGFALHEIICDEKGIPIDYRFLEVNPAFERLTGLRSENLIGKTVLEVLPNTESYWIEVYGTVALTGRSTFYENYHGELGRHFEVSVYCPRPGQFAVITVDITERKQAEEATHQRVTELEMLYQSGLALSQLLDPKEIGQKILELLAEKLNWHHTRIRLYHPQDDKLELLDFNKPGLEGDLERHEAVDHFQSLIPHSGQGMSGWVIQHGQSICSGDVKHDPRYVEAYPGIRSGLYVPMKLGERVIGVISIEDETPNAFNKADERLIVTLANQAASAFENARLFEEIHKRVMELETLNRISLVLRTISRQNELLPIVLDEALAILNTSHGSIEIYNNSTGYLEKVITRGWLNRLNESPQSAHAGIVGKVFTGSETHFSREFASDPATREETRGQIPPNWGGVCLPIRTTQQTLGVILVSVPSERKLDSDEIRMLSILSEMTGAALQRMQLHEQTARRLEQLNALRAVEQSISSSHDMRLTLTILLSHIISQLEVDAADVLLLHPGSSLLELVSGRGFRTLGLENARLSDSFAGRAIMERRSFLEIGIETASQNPHFGKLWKEEGFVRYWCVPLVVKGEIKGALEVYCRRKFSPNAEWIKFLEAFAGQAAIAIDNTQLFEDLQRANMDLSLAYDATIEGWSRAMDLRDHETEGHTLRVTDLTLSLARAMQINESQLTAIRRGALLHDIGKMGVPDAILLKDGKLTEEEWSIMRQHPQFAYDMLLPINYLHESLDIPYCHHEKWDGTGYPQGLKGNQIPLAARIFAVVDVWDALTNDRTYRKEWTKEKAREYIREQSGSHFDPQVVDVFLKNIAED